MLRTSFPVGNSAIVYFPFTVPFLTLWNMTIEYYEIVLLLSQKVAVPSSNRMDSFYIINWEVGFMTGFISFPEVNSLKVFGYFREYYKST